MYSSTETDAQKSKNLLGENPIVNRAGPKKYGKDYESGGPGMYKTGPDPIKDEFGTSVPKDFKSDMGKINPTITSTTRTNKNQRPMTDGSNEPFSVGSVIKTSSDGKRTTSTILDSKLKNSELSKPSSVRNKKNLKSQKIKHRIDTYSDGSDGLPMMSKGPHKEKWERLANRARRQNEKGNTAKANKLEARARENYRN
tara:strand:+ start:128 stop:721 length:594 start_codon:yes stop_codon:yes gene_type:complete